MKNISTAGQFAIMLSSSLTIMVGTVIAPSLKEISTNLGFTANPAWLITLPALGVVLFASLAGKLLDNKGPLFTLCAGLIPYGFFGVAGIWLYQPWLLVIDRLLLGAATAAVQASATGLIYQYFKGDNRIKLIAWQGMSIELGGVLYLSLGGYLAELGWAYPFYIYLLAFVCLLLILRHIPKSASTAVQSPEKHQITKNMWSILVLATLSMVLFFAAIVNLPQYLPAAFNFSPGQTGYFMAFISIIAVVAASMIPKAINLLKTRFTLLIGFGCFLLSHLVFSITTNIVGLYLAAILLGIGFGFTVPLLNHMTLQESNPKNVGRNLGYYSIGIFGGQFLSSFLGYISNDYQHIFRITAGLAFLIGILITFFDTRRNNYYS